MTGQQSDTVKTINLLWRETPEKGTINVVCGKLKSLTADGGSVQGDTFSFPGGTGRLIVEIAQARCEYNQKPTVVQLRGAKHPVTFYLRDALMSDYPVFIPEYGFAAVPGDDRRTWSDVAADVQSVKRLSDHERFALTAEETFDDAAARHRRRFCPTVLGLGRDMRTFRMHWGYRERWAEVRPGFAAHETRRRDPDKADDFCSITFTLGHGGTAMANWKRRLDMGTLPILCVQQDDGPIVYKLTAFTTLENGPLAHGRVEGTAPENFYPCTSCNMLKREEQERYRRFANSEMYEGAEQVLAWCRIMVVNTSAMPQYACLSAPRMAPWLEYNRNSWSSKDFTFDSEKGFSMDRDRVYAVNLIDGRPFPSANYTFPVYPDRPLAVDFIIPHAPIEPERAVAVSAQDYEAHLAAVRAYWQAKAEEGRAAITVPERKINEIIQAGMHQCDLISFGREPDGPVGVSVGSFGPIGSESAPIIEFFDAMGRHKLAERALEYFFDKQRADGFIQGFAEYESETGPVLALVGNHLRYSGNVDWVRKMAPKIAPACRYMLEWRNKNKTEELKARGGYGMIHGKVADAYIFNHDFCINAWAYLGLKRCAEALADIEPALAAEIQAELPAYKNDILNGLRHSQECAPLIPTGNGTWAPLQVKWADTTPEGLPVYWPGNSCFDLGGTYGPTYLVMGELLDADDVMCDLTMKANQYPRTIENQSYNQPYYSRHDFAHLRRGEVEAFLKVYYNHLCSVMDQDTYTFWEHVHDHGSVHKTHEQGWFLMQTRWMLWLEEGKDLRLLAGIPRAWLEDGKNIALDNVVSYFGRLTLRVESHLSEGFIRACGECGGAGMPECVKLRLPHPQRHTPVKVVGGIYDAATETVRIDKFTGKFEVTVKF